MKRVIIENQPELSYSVKESLRAIRTNIQFCGSDFKSILITSATPGEGKSTVTFEVAKSLAELDKKVLFVDTDIRKSVLVKRLSVKTEDKTRLKGLSHFLSGQNTINDVMYSTDISNLYTIFAGPSVPNATEIFENRNFTSLMQAAREKFDYIVLDTAPITAAIDSSLIAKFCDGAILVVEPEANPTRLINRCVKQLSASGIKILGVILNKVQYKKNNYYGKYYGSYYGNYYGNEEKDTR